MQLCISWAKIGTQPWFSRPAINRILQRDERIAIAKEREVSTINKKRMNTGASLLPIIEICLENEVGMA
jgi:hypothetical protein